jgi:hypothetical protein
MGAKTCDGAAAPGNLDRALDLPKLRHSVAALCLSITEV